MPPIGADFTGDILLTGDVGDPFYIAGGQNDVSPLYVRYKIRPRTRINGVLVEGSKAEWSPWVEITRGRIPGPPKRSPTFYLRFRNALDAAGGLNLTSNSAISMNNGDQLRDSLLTVSLPTGRGLQSISYRDLATDNVMTRLVRDSGGGGMRGLIGFYTKLIEGDFNDIAGYETAFGGKRGNSGKLLEKDLFTGVSYSNTANYSILVDARLGPTSPFAAGFNLVINPVINNVSNFTGSSNTRAVMDGFSVAYDYNSSNQAGLPESGQNIRMLRFANSDTPSGSLHGTTALYNPEHMRNSKFTFSKSTAADWQSRKRIMYTILEYYDTAAKQIKFIVRVKFLTPLHVPSRIPGMSDNDYSVGILAAAQKKYDYYFIGKDFHLSEPIWFGQYVGSPDPDEGGFIMYNFDNPGGITGFTPSGTLNSNYNSYGVANPSRTAFGRKSVDAVNNQTKFSVSADGKITFTGERYNPYPRYWGLQMIANDFNAMMTIYSIDLAPGFAEGELKAILPENARLLNPGELYPQATKSFEYIDLNDGPLYPGEDPMRPNLNRHLFGTLNGVSDGRGNRGGNSALPVGVNQIQYPRYKPFYLEDPVYED